MSVFEIVRGVEGDCLVLDDTRICGPKPWGGGRIIKTFHTDGIYEVIDKDEYHKLQAENAKLRELTRDYLIFYSQPGCTYCFCHDECRESEETCMAFERLVDRTNELGIEVPR